MGIMQLKHIMERSESNIKTHKYKYNTELITCRVSVPLYELIKDMSRGIGIPMTDVVVASFCKEHADILKQLDTPEYKSNPLLI